MLVNVALATVTAKLPSHSDFMQLRFIFSLILFQLAEGEERGRECSQSASVASKITQALTSNGHWSLTGRWWREKTEDQMSTPYSDHLLLDRTLWPPHLNTDQSWVCKSLACGSHFPTTLFCRLIHRSYPSLPQAVIIISGLSVEIQIPERQIDPWEVT